jgi:dolichyl-phosphate-mannose-protein mannosyltransferase
LADFWEMQKQMWWYHTKLDASHPYTSPWWSWPLLMRPIYLYVEYSGELVRKIYAMGNPAVFWTGIAAVVYSLYRVVQLREKKLALVVGSYFIFFVPWAVSPRIMFLYHYLPSLPFMAILIGFTVKKKKKFILPFYLFTLLLYLYFYPHWVGLAVPEWLDGTYYWFPSWR